MDLSLETIDVWKFEGDIPPLAFLQSIRSLVSSGDIAMFGSYEPTPLLQDALLALGARKHLHLEGFFMCFDFNRCEHPNGCAFEYTVHDSAFADILDLDSSILQQKDIPSFFDHFIAYRPGIPMTPLISFHDAACGGTLYLSGLYSESVAHGLGQRLDVPFSRIQNPVLNFKNQ
jgi:hypothetical protein